jgi:lipopolysaccharide export system permease protein
VSTARSKTRIPGLVEHSILTGIAGRVGLILLLVEAIFLGEKFPDLFNTVVERNGRLWDVFLLMICATPEIFDLALALALLVAVYQVLLRSRENRELQVIAGAGIGTFEFVKFALAVGVVALIGSMLNSGVVEPAAQYAKRVVLFNAEYRALLRTPGDSQFYSFPSDTVYVSTQADHPDEHSVFIEEKSGDTDRAITAENMKITNPGGDGRLTLILSGIKVLNLDTASDCDSAGAGVHKAGENCANAEPDQSPTLIEAQRAVRRLDIADLVPFQERGGTTDELMAFGLLQRILGSTSDGQDAIRAFGDLIGRGLLGLFAPLLALTALCFTDRRTQTVAIPIALLLLMALNLLAVALTRSLSHLGAPALLAGILFEGLAIVAALTGMIYRAQNRLVLPALNKP